MIHATIVGIDIYGANIPAASHAERDATDFAQELQRRASDAEVDLLLGEQATSSAFRAAIGRSERGRGLAHGDVLLIYFAGNGAVELPSPNSGIPNRYLLTHDSNVEDLPDTSISLAADVHAESIHRLSPAALVALILDCSFSGKPGRSVCGPNLAARRAQLRAGVPLPSHQLGEGWVVLSACRDDEPALDDAIGHGLFSKALLEVLRSSDGELSFASLYDQAYSRVRRDSKAHQSPTFYGRFEGARLPRV